MSANRKLLVFDSTHKLTNYFLKFFIATAQEAIRQNGRFVVALSGGKTPIEFYSKLAGWGDMDFWSKVHIFQTDERFISNDDSDSNYRMIRESLLDFVPIPSANIHVFSVDVQSAAESARLYEQQMKDFFVLKDNDIPQFDLILLGVGEDGHTASLFPEYLAVTIDEKCWVVDVQPKTVRFPRISLNFPILRQAKQIVFLATGVNKAKILSEILEHNLAVPVNMVQPVNGAVLFFVDQAAVVQMSDRHEITHDGDAIRIFV